MRAREFEEFFIETKNRFFSYLVKIVGNREDATDILQEAYTKMFENYRHNLSKPLLYKIGYNLFIDMKRRSKFKAEVADTDIENSVSSAYNAFELALIDEKYEGVLKMLEKLPEDERNLISMVSSGDLTYREIGKILNMSEGNIKIKVYRIRKKLKEMMRKEGLI
ncbi:RNA polymerase sigma factor [Hippea alviniae]|uniref:RNA polymerase sigma factor n=1 Tax=Hippea alviniae TaxID=1279027 RepID=UPI0003B794A4|nr:RNA polymerase sigma factor [Hippea alviniae]